MYETCETGCCSTNVPVRDSTHAECHCGDTHWCESPVINKGISNCDDGCCTTNTVTIRNSDQIDQYIEGLASEHMGYSEHNIGNTLCDISKKKISDNCCPPSRVCETRPVNYGITDSSCGSSSYTGRIRQEVNSCIGLQTSCDPALYYEDFNCNTADGSSCCETVDGRNYIRGLANRVRGRLNHKCHTYGNIRETIKEIPAADVYLVNHEFIDLLIDEITGCLPVNNLSRSVVDRVKRYVELYYVYYKDLELVGSLVINDVVSITEDLIMKEEDVNRIKAVLYALSDRLKGKIYGYEQ